MAADPEMYRGDDRRCDGCQAKAEVAALRKAWKATKAALAKALASERKAWATYVAECEHHNKVEDDLRRKVERAEMLRKQTAEKLEQVRGWWLEAKAKLDEFERIEVISMNWKRGDPFEVNYKVPHLAASAFVQSLAESLGEAPNFVTMAFVHPSEGLINCTISRADAETVESKYLKVCDLARVALEAANPNGEAWRCPRFADLAAAVDMGWHNRDDPTTCEAADFSIFEMGANGIAGEPWSYTAPDDGQACA